MKVRDFYYILIILYPSNLYIIWLGKEIDFPGLERVAVALISNIIRIFIKEKRIKAKVELQFPGLL